MPKYYVDEKRQVYLVNDNYHELLDSKAAMAVLSGLLSSNILGAELNGQYISSLFNNNTVTFDSNAFNSMGDEKDSYLEQIKSKIINVLREKMRTDANFKKYVARLPKGFTPTINRRKEIGTLILSGALAISAILYAILPNMKEANKTEELFTPEIPIEDSVLEKPSIIPNVIVEEPSLEISNDTPNMTTEDSKELIPSESEALPENDLNVNAVASYCVATKGDYEKLERVIEDCAPFIEPFIKRYNLPRELTYSLLCQEDGNLDAGVRANGGIGPMQIQKGEINGEYFNVPVYENGTLTGEYDEFYVVDYEEERKKYEEEGYKVLVSTNLEDNFQIGCAYFRRCINRYKNIFIALDAYNKGLYAFSNVFNDDYITPEQEKDYYQENLNDFSWVNFISDYYKVRKNNPDYVYGDPNYIWNVLRYMIYDELGTTLISYDCEGEALNVALTNNNLVDKNLDNDYNIGPTRG